MGKREEGGGWGGRDLEGWGDWDEESGERFPPSLSVSLSETLGFSVLGKETISARGQERSYLKKKKKKKYYTPVIITHFGAHF